jgi:hypothetical protein
MLLAAVTLAMLASASSALASQQRGRVATSARGLFGIGMLMRQHVEGPAWVKHNLPRSRSRGGGSGGNWSGGGNGGSGNWGGGGNGGSGNWGGGGNSGNGGGGDWGSGGGNQGQPFSCAGTFTGITVGDVIVRPYHTCLLTDSVIRGDVRVQSSGDFEAGNTLIRGNVEGTGALTIYVYNGSTVGGDLDTNNSSQVFAFNSTVQGNISVIGSTDQVFLCNNTIGNGITVLRSGPNILVGDDQDPNCLGNIVEHGNVWVSQNATYVELVVADNLVLDGSMWVTDNTGTPTFTSGESVLNNQGAGTLFCFGNASPFVGSPNPGWLQYGGDQCSAT